MVVSAFALAWLAAAVQSERVWAGHALAAAIQAASAVAVFILTMTSFR